MLQITIIRVECHRVKHINVTVCTDLLRGTSQEAQRQHALALMAHTQRISRLSTPINDRFR